MTTRITREAESLTRTSVGQRPTLGRVPIWSPVRATAPVGLVRGWHVS
ncbi:MAG: hypothetical protein FWG05_00045 [Kiritimatiellaeota bacterium]|nr:hypothetical protein [Kiritimatiellota bacterium]